MLFLCSCYQRDEFIRVQSLPGCLIQTISRYTLPISLSKQRVNEATGPKA